MEDEKNTIEQLINELAELRQRALELEKSEAERKRAEQEAQEAREYAESIIETVREPLLVLDSHLRVKTASRAFYKVFRVSPEEIKGKFIYDLGNRQWDIPKLRKLLEEIIPMNNQFQDFEIDHEFPIIGLRIMLLNARRIYRKDIGTQAILLAIEDITERKQIEEKLKITMADMERSNKELEQFAYVASHDLQEPLRMVASFTQLLEKRYKGKLDNDADEFIGFVVDGTTRMQRMIDDLLGYSRVGTRGKPFQPTDCEIIFNEAIANLKAAIEGSSAAITHDPLPTITADGSQMVQLFQNLLSNAIKFCKEKPHVHISARQDGSDWVFSVKDNGIGIAPEFFDRLFQIFQRQHTRSEYPGTGIGLAVCKKIVQRHGGRIWVESEPGKGSTFYFTIPMGS